MTTTPTLTDHLAAHRRVSNWLAPEDQCEPVTLEEGLTNWHAACSCGWHGPRLGSVAQADADHEAHIAATWREARTITTVEQLEALPAETVIRDAESAVWERSPRGRWWETGVKDAQSSTLITLPAVVLWQPADEGSAS